ncbi:VWA domain-containing protein [Corynebacterium sp. MSK008]|uniref:vWA domain-containing protein n=1 Tax=Corynebacterium sp. MSK008 TaxID=3050188 RepID=UPI00254D556F|nr:VWA domain-containing protein [Corynebacterium sp. MSK008]MDK8879433.1 VWA domain-containing protein [Corynebacterium sp. MSK008]
MSWSVSQKGARVVLALMIAVCCCLAWAPVAWGQSSSTAVSTVTETSSSTTSTNTSSAASEGSEDSKAMLILDASSSMVEADAEGTRMESAKKAANELVESLPETANMGLMAYGANESDAPDNRERGCKDVETLAKVGKIDKAKFTSAIDGLEPKGYTPMGNSLRKAAEELGDEGERSIILVSDGIDSCAPPPVCEVAKELAEDGVDLAIHTVGFQVDDAARKELQCIAEAGNGQFLEAKDASSLATSLKFLAQRDIGKYKVEGTPFEFADSPDSAKWLGEGQYQTKVTPDSNAKTDRYFRVSVPEGYNALIAMTPIWQPDGHFEDAEVVLESSAQTNENDPNCGRAKTKLSPASIAGSAKFAMEPYWISLAREDQLDNCDMSDWLITTQIFKRGAELVDDVNVEVNVFYSPIPDAEQAKEWSGRSISSGKYDGEVPLGTSQEITGGTSFNDAVEISEGTYADKIVPGEYRFYKIPVTWGQRPVMKMKVSESVTNDADSMKIKIFDPTRIETATRDFSFYDKEEESGPVSPAQFTMYGGDNPHQGYYFLHVGMGAKSEGEATGVEQPYEFAVMLDGEPVDGGPDWTPTYENGPEPSDEPIKFDGASGSDEEQTVEETTQAAESTEAAEDKSGGLSLPLLGGLAVLLLAVIGAVVFLLNRNRA